MNLPKMKSAAFLSMIENIEMSSIAFLGENRMAVIQWGKG